MVLDTTLAKSPQLEITIKNVHSGNIIAVGTFRTESECMAYYNKFSKYFKQHTCYEIKTLAA